MKIPPFRTGLGLLCFAFFGNPLFGQIASNGNTGITYPSLQTALDSTLHNQTLYLLGNSYESTGLVLSNRTNVLFLSPPGAARFKILSSTHGVGNGLTLTNCNRVTISNLEFRNWSGGLRIVNGSTFNTVSLCSFVSNPANGIQIQSGAKGNVLHQNVFDHPNGGIGTGVDLASTLSNRVTANTFSNMLYGISLGNSSNNFISSNTISNGNGTGIQGNSITVSGNEIWSNRVLGGSLTTAVYLNQGISNRIFSNVFIDGGRGIQMNSSTNTSIFHNQFISNSYAAVDTAFGCRSNEILSNYIFSPNAQYGLTLDGTTGNSLLSNTLIAQTNGIWVGTGIAAHENTIALNLILSNSSRALVLGAGSCSNQILGNTIRADQFLMFVQFMAGCDFNTFNSNTVTGFATGLFLQNNTSNRACFNTFVSNDTSVWVQGAPSKGHILASNTVWSPIGTTGFVLNLDSFSNLVISNHIVGPSNGLTFDAFNFATNHLIYDNDFEDCAVNGVYIQGKSFGARIINNRFRGGSNGIRFAPGVTNVQLLNNTFSTPGVALTLQSNTNVTLFANIISNAQIGLMVGYAVSGLNASMNSLDCLAWNVSNLSLSLDLRTNAFGTTNRPWASKRISAMTPPFTDPWINLLPAMNSDFQPPSPPSALVVTNGVPGRVHLNWVASYPADFASARIYRSRTSNNYSNLTDTEFLMSTNAFAATSSVDQPTNGGHYHYYMTVMDVNGNESIYSPQATVFYIDPPAPSFTFSPTNAITNQAISFSSTSTSGTGLITNYRWIFGDGTSSSGTSLSSTSHPYAAATNTWVTLVLQSDLGQSVSNSNAITIHAPPTALFSGPTTVATNRAVVWTNTSLAGDSPITNAFWNFGDGTSAFDTNSLISHTFSAAQTNVASLIVYDALGQTNGIAKTIAVVAPPVASPSIPPFGATNAILSFAANGTKGTGLLTNFRWDFGDGAQVSGSNLGLTNHAYGTVGSYTVSLTVMDDLGFSNVYSQTIQIGTWYLLGGILSGHAFPITLSLSGSQSFSTNSGSNGNEFYGFWVSNGTYTVTPTAVGYQFSPASRTFVVHFNSDTNQHFSALPITPTLTFSNLTAGQKVKRTVTVQFVANPSDMFTGRPVTLTIQSNGSSVPFISNTTVYGSSHPFDTTFLPDGNYSLLASTTDLPFGRTQTLGMVLQLDNNLFKALGKDVSNQKAIVFDTVRSPGRGQPAEIYFHLRRSVPVSVSIHDKRGGLVKSFGTMDYPTGLNLVTWNPGSGGMESGVYFVVIRCEEFEKKLPLILTTQ